jgi:light-regulated signal transduction histidine kinase (bacteriophytochrome)
MDKTNDFINTEGLKFFGKVNASISHELKNILAIISETAGFLNDLADLAKKGQNLKISMIEECSDSIAEDIQRGFTTIKQMNQFAHSVDTPVKEIDLLEILQLTIKLSGFLSFSNSVQISNIENNIQPVLTCPFLLHNLLYQILIFTYESTGSSGDIHISLNSSNKDGVHLVFSSPSILNLKIFPTPKIQKAAHILGVDFSISQSLQELDIWIPYTSNQIVVLAKELQIDSKRDNDVNGM